MTDSDNSEIIESLLKKDFSLEMIDNIQLSINQHIKDYESKELLYRLSLINWNYGMKEILEVSQVEEKINHPYSKLQELTHTWLHKYPKNLFSNSPLINEIGNLNLPPNTVKSIYLRLAKLLLENNKIDQLIASRIISSFLKGGDPENACITLLLVYKSAITFDEAKLLEQWGYLGYWLTGDIPNDTNLVTKGFIRLEQIRISKLLGKPTEVYSTFLNQYLKGSESESDKILIRFLLISDPQELDLKTYFKHSKEIIENSHLLSEQFQDIFDPDSVSAHLWLKVQEICNGEDLETWQELISKFYKKFGTNVLENPLAREAIIIIIQNIILKEQGNNADQRNWIKISSILTGFAKFLESFQQEILASLVMREVVSLKFIELDNPEEAKKTTEHYLSKYSSKEAKYYLKENLGKLLFKYDYQEESYKWLSEAILYNCKLERNFPTTLLYAACAISKKNPSMALSYAKEANIIASKNEELNDLEVLLIKAELGISFWINNENLNSFITIKDVVYDLFAIKEENFGEQWIRQFSWLGHSLGYIAQDVSRASKLTHFDDGSKYIEPYQGIILNNTKSLSDIYKPQNDALIPLQLAMMAEGVNEKYDTYEISLKSFDLARRTDNEKVLQMILMLSSQYAIANNKISEALETSLFFSAISEYKQINGIESYISLKNLQELKPNDIWNIAEKNTVTFTIIPLYILNISHNGTSDSLIPLIDAIEEYAPKASNRNYWNKLIELLQSLSNTELEEKELIELANHYGDTDQSSLQNLVLISLIEKINDPEKKFNTIMNLFPILFELSSASTAIKKFIYLPYFKNTLQELLRKEYFGSKTELDEIIKEMSEIDSSDTKALQKIVLLFTSNTEFEVPMQRKDWITK